MEKFTRAHKALQKIAAEIYSTGQDCERLIAESGSATLRINMSEPSIQRWFFILDEFRKLDDGSMERIVQLMISEYPENDTLVDACAPWIPAEPATNSLDNRETGKHARDLLSDPPIVPVVVPLDFADEADSLIPRVDTLWEAMREISERIDDINERLKNQETWLVNMDTWARSYPFGRAKAEDGPVEGEAT